MTPQQEKWMRLGLLKSVAPPIEPKSKRELWRGDREKRTGICCRCGKPAQEYTPGNFSVQCVECNDIAARKQRERSARLRARREAMR